MAGIARREVLGAFGGAALVWTIGAPAQRMPVVGFVRGTTPGDSARLSYASEGS
jgi:hypothetical protein